MMRVVLHGWWRRNLGDDLFLESFKNRFVNKGDSIYILTLKEFKAYYKSKGLIPICSNGLLYRGINRFSRWLFSHDFYYFLCNKHSLFVVLGGSLFQEGTGKDRRLNNLSYAVNHSLSSCIVGSNFGPFKSSNYLGEYAELFSGMDDVCFRDEYSAELFSNLNNVHYAPDLILAGFWDRGEERDDSYSPHEETVVFAPVDLSDRPKLREFKECYENLHVSLMKRYIEQGVKVKLVPFCEFRGDLKVCERLKARLNNSELVELCQYDEKNIIEVFRTCRIVYSTRFHAMILAMYFGKTCVPFVYDEKIRNAVKSYVGEHELLSVSDLQRIDSVEMVISHCTEFQIGSAIEMARQQFGYLESIYSSHK